MNKKGRHTHFLKHYPFKCERSERTYNFDYVKRKRRDGGCRRVKKEIRVDGRIQQFNFLSGCR